MLDLRPRGRGIEPHRRHCVVSLSKNINPSIVLVQPRKTRPFITERLLMGCKESYQTKTNKKVPEMNAREYHVFAFVNVSRNALQSLVIYSKLLICLTPNYS